MLQELIQRYPRLTCCEETIFSAFLLLAKCFEQQNKLLIAGNGGSASDADHIAGELLKAFKYKTPLRFPQVSEKLSGHLQPALPAIPLTNLHGVLSAYGNDCDFKWGLAQLVFGLGRENDILLALSTSGQSENILNAALTAKEKHMPVIGLTGHSGGALKELCDICICVPEEVTFKVQELHLPIYHCLCLMLEEHFLNARDTH